MSNYVKNGVFNHGKWQRDQYLNEGPGNDPALKSLRTQIPGEKFPELKTWWEYEPDDIMTYVYWHQKQLPPTGAKFDKEWASIVKQLHSRHPIPSNVRPGGDVTEAAQATRPLKPFTPGDKWANDFDYTGMLKWGINASHETMEISELKAGYESFTDVNYHTEGAHLGDAIDYMEGAVAEREHGKVEEFMSDFNSACAKTLKDITRGK